MNQTASIQDPRASILVPEPSPAPKGVLVEIDPPKNLNLEPLRACAKALADAGIRHVTLADNPMASARMDVVTVAGILAREFNLSPIPHLTGRDRNRLALKSSLMAAHALGLRQVLCVTGDPLGKQEEKPAKAVFDLTSVGLVELAAGFNSGRELGPENRTDFGIGVAFNPNGWHPEIQAKRLLEKIEAGAHYVLSQPIYTKEGLERVLELFARFGIDIPFFCGVMPLVSSKTAEYLHAKVPGITIPDAVRTRLQRYPQAADQRRAGLELAVALAEELSGLNENFYLITPKNDAEAVLPVIQRLAEQGVSLY